MLSLFGNKSIKKALLFFMALTLLYCPIVSAAGGIEIIKSEFDSANVRYTLIGTAQSAKNGESVMLELYDPSGNIAAADMAKAKNGGFSFTNVLLYENSPSGWYKARLSLKYGGMPFEITDVFYFGGKDNAREILKKIDAAESISEIDSLIRENYLTLGFSKMDMYEKCTSVEVILKDIKNCDFNNLETDLENEWEKFLKLLDKGTLAAFILDTSDEKEIEKIIKNGEYTDMLGIDVSDSSIYKKLSNEGKAELYKLMLSAVYKNASELPQVFKDKSAVSYLRTGRYTDLTEIFDMVSDIYEWNSAKFNKLAPKKQNEIIKDTTEFSKSSGDITEIVKYFNSLTDKSSKPSDDSGSGSGGSSSGGGSSSSGGGSTNAYTPIIKTDDTPKTGKAVFSDIDGVSWAKEAIEGLYKKGIVNGTAKNEFSPDKNVTRAEFSKMASLNFKISQSSENVFSDVPENSWYTGYVNGLYKAGMVNGVGENMFAPESFIKREDIFVMVYRILKADENGTEKVREFSSARFSDFDTVSDYAKEGIIALYEYGIINGDNGYINPHAFATRAQTAKILWSIGE